MILHIPSKSACILFIWTYNVVLRLDVRIGFDFNIFQALTAKLSKDYTLNTQSKTVKIIYIVQMALYKSRLVNYPQNKKWVPKIYLLIGFFYLSHLLSPTEHRMDKTALSSNWKKLQATLKKDPTVKRKPSELDSGNGIVKKRKLTEKQKPYNRDAKPTLKRKRMSDKKETGDSADASAPKIETSSRHKENEGRSPR